MTALPALSSALDLALDMASSLLLLSRMDQKLVRQTPPPRPIPKRLKAPPWGPQPPTGLNAVALDLATERIDYTNRQARLILLLPTVAVEIVLVGVVLPQVDAGDH